MKVCAIAQARMGSTRAPGKVMRELSGRPVLAWTIEALRFASGIDEVILATSTLEADDVIAEWCDKNGVTCFRGSESDVLDRFYQCAVQNDADIILRLTCDCPWLDSAVISEVVKLREMTGAHYASNIDPPSYPDGLDVECFTFEALHAAWSEASRPTDRDCVPQFISRNRSRFKAVNLTCPLPGLAKERWVLDTEDDFAFCQKIAERFQHGVSYLEILNLLDKEPELRRINSSGIRNERFYEGLATESLPPRTFERSQRVFDRAIRTIPFGAQTFSKSHLQFPAGHAPLYCTHADGARIFDVDGNDYVDLVNAVLPVVLGYRDPDVDEAIRRQLDNGISFSLATELEAELSELLVKHIPCAEMVKFGKSGTDVTTAAIRLARAYTGRDHVLLSGYHGWSDWSMAATDRNLGIPRAVKELTHRVDLVSGDIDSPVGPKNFAALILEPNDNPENLKKAREFCDQWGIVLIFDEVITGFRYDMGGAQKLFGVTPDLACFGKAMANGMPISAIVGKRDIMRLMSPPNNIFYSGTMFGETLSIAAAIACIKKLEREDVISHICSTGMTLYTEIEALISKHSLKDIVSVTGHPSRLMVNFKDGASATKDQIRTLFMMEMAQGGVLIINSNNLSFAHKEPELKRILTAYDRAFTIISDGLRRGDIASRVGSSVVEAAPLRATA